MWGAMGGDFVPLHSEARLGLTRMLYVPGLVSELYSTSFPLTVTAFRCFGALDILDTLGIRPMGVLGLQTPSLYFTSTHCVLFVCSIPLSPPPLFLMEWNLRKPRSGFFPSGTAKDVVFI